MLKANRYAAALLLTGAMAMPLVVFATPAPQDHRYYDKEHKDYHHWNDQENGAWHRYLNENHRKEHEFAKSNKREQSEYWKWRHDHPE